MSEKQLLFDSNHFYQDVKNADQSGYTGNSNYTISYTGGRSSDDRVHLLDGERELAQNSGRSRSRVGRPSSESGGCQDEQYISRSQQGENRKLTLITRL